MMRAVIFNDYGSPNVLKQIDMVRPVAADGEILISVRAIGVNPADWKWRAGFFAEMAAIPLPHILGYDVAGEVAAIGPNAHGWAVGDRILAMLDPIRKGGYAEFVCCPAVQCVHMPDTLSFIEAAALPTPAMTGFQMIEEHIAPKKGQRILVTGAVGAVGRFAMAKANAMGAKCVAAVRTNQGDQALALGADSVIFLDGPSMPPPLVDHIADTVGGADVARLCAGLVADGRIITVATTPIEGVSLPKPPQFIAVHQNPAMLAEIAQMAAAGSLSLPFIETLPLASAADAHRRLEAGSPGAKLVLLP
jgi:NADPH:quinone reductase